MGSFEDVKQSRGWCCGLLLSGPRLLYSYGPPAGGGLPRAVCGDQAQNPGVVLDGGSTASECVASGGRWHVVGGGRYAAMVTVIAWGTTCLYLLEAGGSA
jgi:hypothetical protein